MNNEEKETTTVGITVTAYKEYKVEVGGDSLRGALERAVRMAREELEEMGFEVACMTASDNTLTYLLEHMRGIEKQEEPESNLEDEVNELYEWVKNKEKKV